MEGGGGVPRWRGRDVTGAALEKRENFGTPVQTAWVVIPPFSAELSFSLSLYTPFFIRRYVSPSLFHGELCFSTVRRPSSAVNRARAQRNSSRPEPEVEVTFSSIDTVAKD